MNEINNALASKVENGEPMSMSLRNSPSVQFEGQGGALNPNASKAGLAAANSKAKLSATMESSLGGG